MDMENPPSNTNLQDYGDDIDDDFAFEKHQLEKADEIRRALNCRNEMIESLNERLRLAQSSLERTKAQLNTATAELVQNERFITDAHRRQGSLIEQVKQLKASEKRLFKENERLSKFAEQSSASELELRTLRADLGRMEAVERKLREELQIIEGRRDADVADLRRKYEQALEISDEQSKQLARKANELEVALHAEREGRLILELDAKRAQAESHEMEKRLRDMERRLEDAEKRAGGEVKRAELAERKLLMETRRADNMVITRKNERVLVDSEVLTLRRKCSDLEGKLERMDADANQRLCEMSSRLDATMSELRRKNAEVFELENKLRGATFLAERKLTRAEKEWMSIMRQTVADVEEREALAQAALTQFGELSDRCAQLTNQLRLISFQRDWFAMVVEEVRPLCQRVLVNYDHPQLLATTPQRVHQRKWRIYATSIVFIFSLKKQCARRHKHDVLSKGLVKDEEKHDERLLLSKNSPEKQAAKSKQQPISQVMSQATFSSMTLSPVQSLPVFAWSFSSVLSSSSSLIQANVEKGLALIADEGAKARAMQSFQKKMIRTREESAQRLEHIRELDRRVNFFESRTEMLEKQLADMQERLDHAQQRETEVTEILHSLERDSTMQTESAVRDRMELEQALDSAEARAKIAFAKAKNLQIKLEQLVKQRDDAIAEARSAREMAMRVEKYAESEIASLTRLLGESTT